MVFYYICRLMKILVGYKVAKKNHEHRSHGGKAKIKRQ